MHQQTAALNKDLYNADRQSSTSDYPKNTPKNYSGRKTTTGDYLEQLEQKETKGIFNSTTMPFLKNNGINSVFTQEIIKAADNTKMMSSTARI